jgi:hypothetical protein
MRLGHAAEHRQPHWIKDLHLGAKVLQNAYGLKRQEAHE